MNERGFAEVAVAHYRLLVLAENLAVAAALCRAHSLGYAECADNIGRPFRPGYALEAK